MTSLPSQHPTLSLHLTDTTLTPLITSSSSQSHLESLTSLATTALTSQSAVQRANLGAPQRIMVEYPDRGAVVLQTYLDPAAALAPPLGPPTRESSRPATAATGAGGVSGSGGMNGNDQIGAAAGAPPAGLPSSEPRHHNSRYQAVQHDDRTRGDDAPPMLVGVVVAGTADEAREARRAAARLERVGRDFQKEWANESSGII